MFIEVIAYTLSLCLVLKFFLFDWIGVICHAIKIYILDCNNLYGRKLPFMFYHSRLYGKLLLCL